ncbi:MAG: DNA-protecting protein DprA [Sphingobacteriales bacterium]|jgi:DNA processing protein|nr:DNA-protecting protein DprA [Sphingobacteriales bacterium]
MNQPDLVYYIALSLLPGIGNITAKHLMSYCGGVKAIFETPRKQLLKIPEVGIKTADIIAQHAESVWPRAEEEVAFIEKNGIQALLFADKNYPQRLKPLHDSPIVLFYKGMANLNMPRSIAIIGTRNATEYGKEICDQLVSEIAQLDPSICVVSGLAYGIDGLAHRACLKHKQPTIGVLAHGLDRIYPPAHRDLAQKMSEQGGGILTELMTGTLPERENFPQRNRIVAGLSDAVVVVQTGQKGGSLITVEYAHSYNRLVFAFPGKINDPYSRGCHQLVKQEKAILCTELTDIADMLFWLPEQNDNSKAKAAQAQLFVELSDTERRVADALQQAGKSLHLSDLMLQTQLGPGIMAATLLNLELKGVVRPQPGSMFVAV